MKEFCKLIGSSLIVLYVMITLCQWSTTKVELWSNGQKRYGKWGRRITLVEVLEQQMKWFKGYKIK